MSKLLLTFGIIAGLLAAGSAISAAEPAPEAGAGANEPLSQIFSSDLFDSVKCESMNIDGDGGLDLQGSVIAKGPRLYLECDRLRRDPKNNTLAAEGNPVKIRQGEIRAQCQKFTYDIETKNSRLEGNPIIYQKSGDKVSQLKGDIITITQNPDGKPSINISQKKGSTRPVSWVIQPTAKGDKHSTGTRQARPGRKIDSKNVDIIKLPEIQ